ncbi:RNA exonuclease ngl2, partial [Spiromyces aspiralis]
MQRQFPSAKNGGDPHKRRYWIDLYPSQPSSFADILAGSTTGRTSTLNEITSAEPYASLKVMSYNVLAQSLVRRDMFPYASKAALRWKTRKQLFINEFTALRPDVACLQEVSTLYYHQDYSMFFKNQGYDHAFFQDRSKSHG